MGLLFQICILNLNAVCYNTSIIKYITLYHVLHFPCLVVCLSTDAVIIEYRIFYKTHQQLGPKGLLFGIVAKDSIYDQNQILSSSIFADYVRVVNYWTGFWQSKKHIFSIFLFLISQPLFHLISRLLCCTIRLLYLVCGCWYKVIT